MPKTTARFFRARTQTSLASVGHFLYTQHLPAQAQKPRRCQNRKTLDKVVPHKPRSAGDENAHKIYSQSITTRRGDELSLERRDLGVELDDRKLNIRPKTYANNDDEHNSPDKISVLKHCSHEIILYQKSGLAQAHPVDNSLRG